MPLPSESATLWAIALRVAELHWVSFISRDARRCGERARGARQWPLCGTLNE